MQLLRGYNPFFFYWKSLSADIRTFILKCDICQRHKYDATTYPGLHQRLAIPDGVWIDINFDFIEGLPKSKWKDIIFVVVDRFNISGYFIAIAHPYTAKFVAHRFLDNVFKLHICQLL